MVTQESRRKISSSLHLYIKIKYHYIENCMSLFFFQHDREGDIAMWSFCLSAMIEFLFFSSGRVSCFSAVIEFCFSALILGGHLD